MIIPKRWDIHNQIYFTIIIKNNFINHKQKHKIRATYLSSFKYTFIKILLGFDKNAFVGFEGVNNLPLFDERQYLKFDKQLALGMNLNINQVNTFTEVIW